MEIEAVVCDESECSSLLVPVTFPEACNLDEGLEECILRNVNNLYVEGEHLLEERQRIFEEESEAQRAFEVLSTVDAKYLKETTSQPSSSTFDSLPTWWEHVTSTEDVHECNLIQDLLNDDEDFTDMMRGLAEHGLLLLRDHNPLLESKSIASAKVKAVGYAGMVLSVNLKTIVGDDEDMIVDVPIKFKDMLPGNIDEISTIREKVLMTVSTVNV